MGTGDTRWGEVYTKEKLDCAVTLDCLCLIREQLKDRSIEFPDILYSQNHNRERRKGKEG